MPTELLSPVAPVSDLPPRTWRGWWLAWPKWLRIGCWAAFGVVVLQIVSVVVLYVGLREPPEIQALRRQGVHIFFSNKGLIPDFSIFGWNVRNPHNGADVAQVIFESPATDADLVHLSQHFSNLMILIIHNGEFTAAGLESLSRCRQLIFLDLSGSEVTDAHLAGLRGMQELQDLGLAETLVTDAGIQHLQQLPRLRGLNLTHTAVSLNAIQQWRQTWKPSFGFQVTTEKDKSGDGVSGMIRWIDGERSGRFPGVFKISVDGPVDGAQLQQRLTDVSTNLNRRHLCWHFSKFAGFEDGDYRFTLKLGDDESEPVIISIENGKSSVSNFEFQMPVTKEQALGVAP